MRQTGKKTFSDMVLRGRANVRKITGVDCHGEAWAVVADGKPVLYTDFRYIPMAHRVAPKLKVRDVKHFDKDLKRLFGGRGAAGRRVGFEKSISVALFERLRKALPKAKFVDVTKEMQKTRAVKDADEIAKMRAASDLNVRIWKDAQKKFRAGMTEREMAGIIRSMMFERGEGEAFDTIVCVGANAAECHHVPDDTVWNGKEPVLVDMGVKLDGYCSDMTRNIVPGAKSLRGCAAGACAKGGRVSSTYRKVYDLVLKANEEAIAAVKPGISGKKLDKIARDVIRKGGFGKCFGHSLGHGVGLEVHEAPNASTKSKWILKPGMYVTIEPGIYLEDNLGVRIEDLVLVTENGCEVLTAASEK